MPFDITTPPRKLYVRLSDFDIAFARYASNTENSFEFVPYQAQPEASLTVNLREAFRTDPSLREACEAEVLVSGPVSRKRTAKLTSSIVSPTPKANAFSTTACPKAMTPSCCLAFQTRRARFWKKPSRMSTTCQPRLPS